MVTVLRVVETGSFVWWGHPHVRDKLEREESELCDSLKCKF